MRRHGIRSVRKDRCSVSDAKEKAVKLVNAVHAMTAALKSEDANLPYVGISIHRVSLDVLQEVAVMLGEDVFEYNVDGIPRFSVSLMREEVQDREEVLHVIAYT